MIILREKDIEKVDKSKLEKLYSKKEINSWDALVKNSEEIPKEIETLESIKESQKEMNSWDEIAGVNSEKPESFSDEEIEKQKMITTDVNEILHKEFDEYLSDDKRKNDITEITQFERHDDFQERFLNKYPKTSQEELNKIVAYYDRENIFVDTDADKQRQLQSLVHEGLHSLSSEKLRIKYGDRLNDGITEFYTRELTPGLSSIKNIELKFDSENFKLTNLQEVTPQYYKEESEVVSLLHNKVPDDYMKKAYFQGNIESLEDSLDSSLDNKDALRSLTELINKKQYGDAKAFLLDKM